LSVDEFAKNTISPRSIPFPKNLTTAPFKTDFLLQRNLKIIGGTIDNQDPTNAVTFRTREFGTIKTIPVNSLAIIEDEEFDFIEVIPDVVTGSCEINLQLATPEELRRLKLLK